MAVDRSNAGSNRDVQQQRLRGGPPMRAALANAKLPFGMGDGMRLPGAHAESVSSTMVLTGADPGAGVTTIALSVGGMEIGPGFPGIPIGRECRIHWVAVSFLADTGSDPWTLTAHYRPSGGTGGFSPVATFEVLTTPP